MDKSTWTVVDEYFNARLLGPDAALDANLRAAADAGLPPINVAANQGRLLELFCRMTGARRVLEVGTLGGYSTTFLARGVGPDGRVLTLELDPRHAATARKSLDHAGVGGRVEIRVGPAAETLAKLPSEGYGREAGNAFDLVFIDADKASTPTYLDHALKLTRPGSTIVIDNVVRNGATADSTKSSPDVDGIRWATEGIGRDNRLLATALQTVGTKGYDGLILALVVA